MRHLRSRTPTSNNLNQLLAIKLGRVQIGALSGRARIAMAVAIHAVAELAVRLFMKEAIAERSGLRGCDYRQHGGDDGDGKLESQSPVFLHRFWAPHTGAIGKLLSSLGSCCVHRAISK